MCIFLCFKQIGVQTIPYFATRTVNCCDYFMITSTLISFLYRKSCETFVICRNGVIVASLLLSTFFNNFRIFLASNSHENIFHHQYYHKRSSMFFWEQQHRHYHKRMMPPVPSRLFHSLNAIRRQHLHVNQHFIYSFSSFWSVSLLIMLLHSYTVWKRMVWKRFNVAL